jgi:hypothetical protein
MKTTQIKTLIRPLLERHSDLAMWGRWIVVKPVRHVFRGILLDRTSGADFTWAKLAVRHLFEFSRTIPLDWGADYPWLDLSKPEHLEYLIDGIDRVSLPELRPVQTIEDLVAYVDKHRARHWLFDMPDTRVIFDAALGNLDDAKAIAEENIDRWSSEDPLWDQEDRQRMAGLVQLHDCLVRGDTAGIAGLLHEWEAATVGRNKLESLWEPTPFPLEKI